MKNFLNHLKGRTVIARASYAIAKTAGANRFMAGLVYIGAIISG